MAPAGLPIRSIVLATSASGPDGDYGATPLNVVSDYQTNLFTGGFTTGYDFALPPAAAGAAPSLHLAYNSGAVDAVGPDTNSQPSNVGIGWELDTGSITRAVKPCEAVYGSTVHGLCSSGDNYVLSLNGLASRLVAQGGNRYRLQRDPLWQVEFFTSTLPAHPDLNKRYWQITTPDGTKYRFGGEFEPETGADQNSVFYVPLHTIGSTGNHIQPPSAWRWNLDRVEDTNGNVASYFYDLELHHYSDPYGYSAKTTYVRAGNLSRIEYTKRAGQATQPHARVLFNMELRCSDPTSTQWCHNYSMFFDAPTDLNCIQICSQTAPAFWSERRLDSLQTQIFDQASGRWHTAGYYDLRHEFPGPLPNRKLWLAGIQQLPGGSYQRSAFTQLEAEKLDAAANVTITEMITKAIDWGMGAYVRSGGANSYIVLHDVDFGSGAASLMLRYQQAVNNATIEIHLDSPGGPQVAVYTKYLYWFDFDKWFAVTTPVTGASGVHDVYVVFKQAAIVLNWLRFLPTAAAPGLPAATYDYVMLNHRRSVVDVSQFSLPRINQVTTELGGSIQVTYGQSHPCPTADYTVRMPYDCFPAFDPANRAYPTAGGETDFALWNKWKVLRLEQRDSFSLNPSEVYTYTYSTPTWHYADNASLPDLYGWYCSTPPCNARHWNEFRGHERVTVTDSRGAATEYRFYRGLNGDRFDKSGGVFTTTITLSDGTQRPDSGWLAGQVAEVRRLKPDGSVVMRTVNWYTATLTAGTVMTGVYSSALQQVEVTTYGAGAGAAGTHTTRTSYEYDAYGNVTGARCCMATSPRRPTTATSRPATPTIRPPTSSPSRSGRSCGRARPAEAPAPNRRSASTCTTTPRWWVRRRSRAT